MNFAHAVKYGKQYLCCNGIRACFVGKYRVLEYLQCEELEKYVMISSTIHLNLSVLSIFYNNFSEMYMSRLIEWNSMYFVQNYVTKKEDMLLINVLTFFQI